jgi:hypothetical protein
MTVARRYNARRVSQQTQGTGMRIAALCPGSIVGVCLAALALLACTALADEPTASATFLPPVAVPAAPQDTDLEQRVRSLEDTIRRLSGQFGPGVSDPAQGGQPPTWPTGAPGQAAPGAPGAGKSGPLPLMTGLPLDSGIILERRPSDTNVGADVHAGWNKGFFIRSLDNSYILRITGQLQTDLHEYLNDRDQTDISQLLERRARLGIDAIVYKAGW